ncbi:MAG: class I SAM-dependent methyltransferase [Candidatus Bathyarchaeota archaeon]|nr:class I SAM-dependent methyltransferase [Candidatus Bathyarchaeota archaeon]
MGSPACRFCGAPLKHTFVDLGMQPLCESYVKAEQLNHMEPFYPLHVRVCDQCFLVQLEEYVSPKEIFCEYAYFSSYSEAWLNHAQAYVDMIVKRLSLNKDSLVVEVASNDGYLLQYFAKYGVPVLGIEPAANVAEVAIKKGIPTVVDFFNLEIANALFKKGQSADLIIGNNVLAQVTDLNGFVESMKVLLKSSGVITMEFPHLMNLVAENQFDTIYHEHFSYFSLLTVEKIFAAHGLTIFDVDRLSTHGGSLRIYACHSEDSSKPVKKSVLDLRETEQQQGYDSLDIYFTFSERVRATKRNLLDFLIRLKREKKTIAGYGAPGKGNTLLNYCGIRSDFLDYTVDRNPYKQGKFLPGTHIPIYSPEKIAKTKPDYIFILPWNIKDEIINQLAYVKAWGAKFIVPIPEVKVYE